MYSHRIPILITICCIWCVAPSELYSFRGVGFLHCTAHEGRLLQMSTSARRRLMRDFRRLQVSFRESNIYKYSWKLEICSSRQEQLRMLHANLSCRMIRRKESLVLRWTIISWFGRLSFLDRMIHLGRGERSSLCLNLLRIILTKPLLCDFWPRCFTRIFTTMDKSVWISYRINGVQYMIFLLFLLRFNLFFATQTRHRPRTQRHQDFIRRTAESTTAGYGRSSSSHG